MKMQRSRTAKSKSMADSAPEITHEEVARLAYSYWEARGRSEGSPAEDWARAEQQLQGRRIPAKASKASAAG